MVLMLKIYILNILHYNIKHILEYIRSPSGFGLSIHKFSLSLHNSNHKLLK
jgi:hypothetical protein